MKFLLNLAKLPIALFFIALGCLLVFCTLPLYMWNWINIVDENKGTNARLKAAYRNEWTRWPFWCHRQAMNLYGVEQRF